MDIDLPLIIGILFLNRQINTAQMITARIRNKHREHNVVCGQVSGYAKTLEGPYVLR